MTLEKFKKRLKKQDKIVEEIIVKSPPFPKNIMIELTNACNHKCLFCKSSTMTRKVGRIDSKVINRIMLEAYDLGVEEIGFYTTGEPFMHKSLPTFISKAKNIGFRYIYISTNGVLAVPERIRNAIDCGLNSIKFSINAGSRETYKKIHGKDDWDIVIENLKYLSRYRSTIKKDIKLHISFTVTKHTEHEVDNFRDTMSPFVDEIIFYTPHNQGGQMNKAQSELLGEVQAPKKNKENFCMMPFNRAHVTYEGYLTACCMDYQNYLALEDLSKTSLFSAWGSDLFKNFRQKHIDNDLTGVLCDNCLNGNCNNVKPIRSKFSTIFDIKNE